MELTNPDYWSQDYSKYYYLKHHLKTAQIIMDSSLRTGYALETLPQVHIYEFIIMQKMDIGLFIVHKNIDH